MSDSIQDPVEVFESLRPFPNDKITKLWPVEKEVLNRYYQFLWKSQDLAVQLPTGSGKSLVGILIAEAWKRSGAKVAILTSTIALSDDMRNKCSELRVDSVVIKGRGDSPEENRQRLRNIKKYKRHQSIGIFNYWSYMYGKDVSEADILIIDDADGFESLLSNHYSIRIPRKSEIWELVVNRLSQYRVYQKLSSFLFGRLPDDYQLIYFSHSIQVAEEIKKMLLSQARSSLSRETISAFEQNKERMHSYLMFVSNDEIILTPQICPTSMHPRLRSVQHIIFMSATIGTPEMLHKRLGFGREITIISEGDLSCQVGTMGKRIIFPLSGLSTTPAVAEPVLDAITRITEEFGKVLILCVSFFDAWKVRNHLTQQSKRVIQYRSESDVEDFRKLDSGILLSAGRFFGLDLSGEACRVVIVPRLPYVLGPTDSLLRDILEDVEYVNEKVSHRLVQGCGRCNRNPSDRAVYFILDGRLASDMLGDSKIFNHFPDRMRAETDYGQEFTETGGLDGAISQGRSLLSNRLVDFDREVNDRMTGESEIGTDAKLRRRPFLEEIRSWHDLCEKHDYLGAAKGFENSAPMFEETNVKYAAWLHYLASFSHHLASLYYNDPSYDEAAIHDLNSAVRLGSSSWFNGLQVVVNELKKSPQDEKLLLNVENQAFKERVIRAWQDFFASNQSKKETPYTVYQRMCQILLQGKHNAVCDALESLLELFGFEVHGTRRETGKPDILAFSTSGTKYLCVIEVKTADHGKELTRDEVDQVTGHKSGYQSQYPDYQIYPLVFTNKEGQSDTALEKAKNNVRILRAPVFLKFANDYYERMEDTAKGSDPGVRLVLLQKIPTLDRLTGAFSSQNQPLVEPADLEIFP